MRTSARACAAVLLLVVACGRDNDEGAGGEDSVRITGTLSIRLDATPPPPGLTCANIDAGEYLDGEPITFLDAEEKVIGTTRLGATRFVEEGGQCVPTLGFGITLPRLDFYQLRAPGSLQPYTISYEELQANGFEWTIDT